jgi:hypothetical protein
MNDETGKTRSSYKRLRRTAVGAATLLAGIVGARALLKPVSNEAQEATSSRRAATKEIVSSEGEAQQPAQRDWSRVRKEDEVYLATAQERHLAKYEELHPREARQRKEKMGEWEKKLDESAEQLARALTPPIL